jgi:aldehyde dehydrogenase (NAD+)
MDHTTFYIGGGWVPAASSERVETRSAVTGELLGSFPRATAADIDQAVLAAREAFDDTDRWAALPPDERADYMEALAGALKSRSADFGRLIAQEVGTPAAFAEAAKVAALRSHLRYYASEARKLGTRDVRPTNVGRTLVRQVPVGVVGMIVPWNYPISLIGFKLGPAMAAGCTAVVKPAPETGLDSYLFAEAVAEAGIPPGVINVVPADREAGEHLVTHPGVDKVAFTGSTCAGRRVGSLCGQALKPVTLELGGKSAAILLEDADLDLFLDNLGFVSFSNNGQTCTNNTRVLTATARYQEVVAAVSEKVASFVVGDPLDPATEIGPLVSARQHARVTGYITAGHRQGGRLTAGAGQPADAGQDGRRGHDRQARRRGRGRLGTRARRGQRPLRRRRPGLDPRSSRPHPDRPGPPGRRGPLAGPGHCGLGTARRRG